MILRHVPHAVRIVVVDNPRKSGLSKALSVYLPAVQSAVVGIRDYVRSCHLHFARSHLSPRLAVRRILRRWRNGHCLTFAPLFDDDIGGRPIRADAEEMLFR